MSNLFSSTMRAFLEAPRFAVLCTLNPDGSPQMTVVWYAIEGNELLMNTASNRQKARNLEHDTRVGITIEDGYRYISIYGNAQLITDQETTLPDIQRLAIRYQGPDEGQRMFDTEFSHEERVSIRVAIERVDTWGFSE